MSVQDTVEAYETRLRERWTPDGEPKIFYIGDDLPSGEHFTIANPDMIHSCEGWKQHPQDTDFDKVDWAVNSKLADIRLENTREICGND